MSSSLHRKNSVTPVVPSPNSRESRTQKPSRRSCTTDPSHCICCSDEAIAGRVLALLPGGMAAVDFGGAVEEVSVALIETAPGDSILVHAKVAIARAAPTETRSGA
jgi:hydrogenase maturation factor